MSLKPLSSELTWSIVQQGASQRLVRWPLTTWPRTGGSCPGVQAHPWLPSDGSERPFQNFVCGGKHKINHVYHSSLFSQQTLTSYQVLHRGNGGIQTVFWLHACDFSWRLTHTVSLDSTQYKKLTTRLWILFSIQKLMLLEWKTFSLFWLHCTHSY